MIVLLHNFSTVTDIVGVEHEKVKTECLGKPMAFSLYKVAEYFPDKIVVWCYKELYAQVDFDFIVRAFPHNRYMYSFNPSGNFFPDAIGYIEESPYIKVNKKVHYPTWQMSSVVGAIHSSTILKISKSFWEKREHFDWVLSAVAKQYQPLGMFCYSEPQLLKDPMLSLSFPKANAVELFSFVAQHYKWVWKHFLVLSMGIYDKKFPLAAWVLSFFKKQGSTSDEALSFDHNPITIDWEQETIDVIIPTIGRKTYLRDVLKDLSVQTHLPKNVIIVEQNPQEGSVSELDYLESESWPFSIRHIFTHQTGACQARNRALEWVESKWCFLNDDDNRFDSNLLKNAILNLRQLEVQAIITYYPVKSEVQKYFHISQTTIFGSGNAFVNSNVLKFIRFNLKLEFGYGEDTEFGLQLRNKGVDVIYIPDLKILHLKAPIGGFRTKFVHPWSNESIQPKPSPTIMFVKQKFSTKHQILGYKIRLFFKTHKYKIWKFSSFQKQWQQSEYWVKTL
ncbi:glycosyltransferase family 2 protein [Flavobacterium luminosum]|uniref:Glycosyltransferase family 2 protein n=1 Tax=Flavobacterium luminosum TaxID=2949086 RepID=A0ABT0TNJ7_9FLAO|nr:glycosyltransferase family A protein [Flavobacterium sp. HXWNR70]MCL9809076.1 glycosyltransferase family 2 protein [Flavobacterium sp. HXWNR70]